MPISEEESIDDTYDQYSLTEFSTAVEDLLQYIRDHKRNYNPVQYKIVFNQRYQSIQQKSREAILQGDAPLEEKLKTLSSVIPLLMEALNIIPKNFRNHQIWFDASILANYMLLNLTAMGRRSDKFRMESMANILSKLLISTPRIRELPEFNYQDTAGIQRVRNALVMTSGVYLETIITIYDIPASKIDIWINEALYHFDQYWKFIDRLNLIKLQKDDTQQYFTLIRFFLMPVWNAMNFILNLNRTLGSGWINKYETYELIPNCKRETMVQSYYNRMEGLIGTTLNQLHELYKSGYYSRNDDPKDSEHIRRMEIILNYAEFYAKNEIYLGGLILGNREHISALNSYASQLKQKIDAEKNDDPPLVSDLVDYYVDLYGIILNYYATTPEVTSLMDQVRHEIRAARDTQVDLLYLLLKAELHHHRNSDYIDHQWFDDIEFLKKRLIFKPRELVDVFILELVLKKYYQQIDLNSADRELIQEAIESVNRADLIVIIDAYLDYLFDDKEFDYPLPEFNIFDRQSWMKPVPDSIIYYPIALAQNKIAPEN